LLLSASVADPFASMAQAKHETRDIRIPPIGLAGTLHVPRDAYALVVFVHGSGSSRLSPRNRAVAGALNGRGIATLLFDLLTPDEEADRANVFDIPLLAARLVDAVNWLDGQPSLAKLPLGLFGASTGAAAALVAATKLPRRVGAVVSRGGRPDLAGDALDRVRAPTLLIVGGADFGVIIPSSDSPCTAAGTSTPTACNNVGSTSTSSTRFSTRLPAAPPCGNLITSGTRMVSS